MSNTEILSCPIRVANPIHARQLPLIARLARFAFHRFRKRWTKRLLKRPVRATFDFAYHVLGLGGRGAMDYDGPDGPRRISFNARNLQFGGVYMYPDWQVYEHPTAALMTALLKDDDVFFDVGANWGCMSLIAAAIQGYRGQIHAFEPVPSTYADLAEVVAGAGLAERIACHRVALSDHPGTGAMTLPDGVNSGWAKVADTGEIEIVLARLDDLTLPPPKLLKVDAEDHELMVFKGAETTLRQARPFLVFENWIDAKRPADSIKILRWLENIGYQLYVPAWRAGSDDETFLAYSNNPPSNPLLPVLALLPILADQRALMTTHMSLFAAHESRRDELIAAFRRHEDTESGR